MSFVTSCRILTAVALTFAALFAVGGVAKASDITVKPIVVVLNSHNRTSSLELENSSEKNLRVQITAYRWEQRPGSVDEMTATDDIIIFPSLLTIEKGQHRSARIGTTLSSGLKEGTYRLVIEELPEAPSASAPYKLNPIVVRTKLVLAAFVSPVNPVAKASIENVSMSHGTMHLRMLNSGNAHFTIRDINLVGLGAGDGTIFKTPISAGYVLPGANYELSYSILASNCTQLREVVIDVATSAGAFKERLPVGVAQCR